ncbi:MAG: hypothetical protein ACOYLB_05915 [Phototrophicaceae bacterium]
MMRLKDNKQLAYTFISLGILIVFMRLTGFSIMSILWPLYVLMPGVFLLYMGFGKQEGHLGWGIPGAIIAGTGLILFTLNLTGRWEMWAYAWAFYPIFIGLALMVAGQQTHQTSLEQGGRVTMRTGLYLLLGFGLFFELVVFGGMKMFGSFWFALVLIIGGIVLLRFNQQHATKDKKML